jgi:flagellar motility protein MotE (MotC chaperone)
MLGYPPLATDSIQIAREKIESKRDSLEREKRKIDTIYIEPQIAMSKEQLDAIQLEKLKIGLINSEKERAVYEKKRLLDSLNGIFRSMSGIKDSISIVKDSLKRSKNKSSALQDSLVKYLSLYEKAKKDLESVTKLQEEQKNKAEDEKFSEKEIENFQKYAKIYENSKPENIAKILEKIDGKGASMILKNMSKKKAGKILEAMNPEQAAAILRMGVEER